MKNKRTQKPQGIKLTDFITRDYLPVTIRATLRQSEKAVKVILRTGFGNRVVWLPKSQMRIDKNGTYWLKRWVWRNLFENKPQVNK